MQLTVIFRVILYNWIHSNLISCCFVVISSINVPTQITPVGSISIFLFQAFFFFWGGIQENLITGLLKTGVKHLTAPSYNAAWAISIILMMEETLCYYSMPSGWLPVQSCWTVWEGNHSARSEHRKKRIRGVEE